MTSRPNPSRGPTASGDRPERIYRAMLALMPRPFRRQASAEMVAVFRDELEDARRAGFPARATFWARTLLDLLRTATDEHRSRNNAIPSRPSIPKRVSAMETLLKDLRFAARTLVRSPGFSLIVVLTLGIGIGANTAIFSVIDGILLRPLPFPEPDRLVAVWADYTRRDGPLREWLSYPDFHDLRELGEVFEQVAAWSSWAPTLTGARQPETLNGAQVSFGMFSGVLEMDPVVGRGFTAADDLPGAPATVLLSHALWTRAFESDPEIVGRDVQLDGASYTVVGVMPPGFNPPFVPRADLWSPLRENMAQHFGSRGSAIYRALARMRPEVPLTTARAAADALGQRLEAAFPDANTGVGYTLVPLQDDIVTPARTALWILFGAVGFVLLMACVNVANLLLARSTSRQSELAVRSALGASRARMARQLLAESLLLAAGGGVLGLGLGALGTRALIAAAPPGTPRIDEVGIDLQLLTFTAATAMASALLFGLMPALRTAGSDLHDRLKQGGRGQAAAASGRRLRAGLVVVQVALALVLLVGAGLLLRTFAALNQVDLGFEPDNVLTVSLNLPGARYTDRSAQAGFYARLEQALVQLPGVAGVGAINSLPLSGNDEDADFQIEGRPPMEPGKERVAWIRRVSPGYMTTLHLRIMAGRGFTPSDDAQAPRVVIINETLAQRYFAGEDPVGRRLWFGDPANPSYREIVGVVGDIKNFGVAHPGRNAIYFPYPQVPTGFMTLVVGASTDPSLLVPSVRATIAGLDPLLAPAAIEPMDRVVRRSLAAERFTAALMSGFAGSALLLAAIGLYGVVSYGVGMRRHEMGVRVALGAHGRDIRRLVVGGSFALVGAGVALGLAAALALTRLLAGLLFGITPTDPLTFLGVIGVMLLVALLAAAIPAGRAARVDPVTVLNRE